MKKAIGSLHGRKKKKENISMWYKEKNNANFGLNPK